MNTKALHRTVALSVLLMFAPAHAEWGGKGSFSPLSLTDDNGQTQTLVWTYRVNGGRPMTIQQTVQGVSLRLSFKFSDLSLSINPISLQRTVSLSAKVSGTASGKVTMNVYESLEANNEGKTLIGDQQLLLDLAVKVQGYSARVLANPIARYTPSSEWFLDRNDLDTLGVGYVYSELGNVTANLSGEACVSIPGLGYDNCFDLSQSATSPETWVITGTLDKMRVQNVDYTSVVSVDRTTVIPNLQSLSGEEGLSTTPVSISYWVAKGIGTIKSVGQFRFLDYPLTLELKKTSFAIPSISKLAAKAASGVSTVKLTGKGFGTIPGTVLLNGSEATVLSWAKSAITVQLPTGMLPGRYSVTVVRNNGVVSNLKPVTIR